MFDILQYLFCCVLIFIGYLLDLNSKELLAFSFITMLGITGSDIIGLLNGFKKEKGYLPAVDIPKTLTKVKKTKSVLPTSHLWIHYRRVTSTKLFW